MVLGGFEEDGGGVGEGVEGAGDDFGALGGMAGGTGGFEGAQGAEGRGFAVALGDGFLGLVPLDGGFGGGGADGRFQNLALAGRLYL